MHVVRDENVDSLHMIVNVQTIHIFISHHELIAVRAAGRHSNTLLDIKYENMCIHRLHEP